MALKQVFTESTLVKYARQVRETPKEVIFNAQLLLSTALFATASIPLSMLTANARPVFVMSH